MTEQEQGGTAPQPEATASAPDEAPEQTAAAVAVADEPATIEDATPAASETPETSETAEVAAPADAAVNGTSAEVVADTPDEAAPAEAALACLCEDRTVSDRPEQPSDQEDTAPLPGLPRSAVPG